MLTWGTPTLGKAPDIDQIMEKSDGDPSQIGSMNYQILIKSWLVVEPPTPLKMMDESSS